MAVRIRVARAALAVMAATVVVKVIGLGKQVYIAALFGTSSDMDAFIVSCLIPMLVAGLISGSFNASSIPLYIEKVEREGQGEADRYLKGLLLRSGAPLLIASVLMCLLSPLFIPLLGWGFDKQTVSLAVRLSRILSFIVILDGITALMGGMLNARGKFSLPALTPAALAITVIAFLIFFKRLGIASLAWGTLAGSFLCMICLGVYASRLGFGWSLKGSVEPGDLRRFASMALPLLCGSAFASVNLVVDKMMASTLARGSVSALNYANSISSAPMDLFIFAATTAILPFFAYQAVRGDVNGFKASFNRAVGAAAFVLLPVTIGIIALGFPLIKLIFQRGMFEYRSTLMTWQAAACFSIGLFPFALGMMLVRRFTAVKDTFTIFKVAFASLGVNILGNYVLMRLMAHAGIALATSATYCFSLWWLLTVLRNREGVAVRGETVKGITVMFFIAAASGSMGYVLYRLDLMGSEFMNLLLGVAALASIYVLGVWLLEKEMLRELLRSLRG